MSYRPALLFLLFILISCGQKKSLGPEEYVRFLNSDHTTTAIVREMNGIAYQLKMQPPTYLALTHAETPIQSEKAFKQEVDYYKDKLNFIFLIKDASADEHRVKSSIFDKAQYGTLLSYANTDLKSDFMLATDKDTLPCALLHLEAANSLQPLLRISLSFHGLDPQAKEYTLIFNDHIYNNGPVKFHYSSTVMKDLPELKF